MLCRFSEKTEPEPPAGQNTEGSDGWLFSIARMDAQKMLETLDFSSFAATVFARDGKGGYFLILRPIEVEDETQTDTMQLKDLTAWADRAAEAFLQANGELIPYSVCMPSSGTRNCTRCGCSCRG